MKKNFVDEMEKEVSRVKEYIPPIAILITADAGAGKFELARKLSKGLAIYLLSNDYVRNYYYEQISEAIEEDKNKLLEEVNQINNERLEFLISHRISFIYDHNIHSMESYEKIHQKLHNQSFKVFKIRIYSNDNYNIKAIRDRKMDLNREDLSVIGDRAFYASSFSEEAYWKLKQRKEIKLEDDWFDFVIHRNDDEEQFMKDINQILEKISNLMED